MMLKENDLVVKKSGSPEAYSTVTPRLLHNVAGPRNAPRMSFKIHILPSRQKQAPKIH